MGKHYQGRGGELPSGGVPILGPDIDPVAPSHVQARVMEERTATNEKHFDKAGRPQLHFRRDQNGGSAINKVTLPRFAFLDRLQAKNLTEGAGL